MASELGWTTGVWSFLANLDFETMGYAIIAIFLISWVAAMAYYRYKGYEKTSFPAKPPTFSCNTSTKETSQMFDADSSTIEKIDSFWETS